MTNKQINTDRPCSDLVPVYGKIWINNLRHLLYVNNHCIVPVQYTCMFCMTLTTNSVLITTIHSENQIISLNIQ